MAAKAHWDAVYRARSVTEVSWFQRDPVISLDLIMRFSPSRESTIVDAGGGASTLVDGLIRRGYRRVIVLDVADAALAAARRRVGAEMLNVRWVVGNVLQCPFERQSVDVWHDRALFHFLTSRKDRQKYIAQVSQAVRPDGRVIVATFAENGPRRCSGLRVCRYTLQLLREEFGSSFELLDHVYEEHVTPNGSTQAFRYCVCALRPAQNAVAYSNSK